MRHVQIKVNSDGTVCFDYYEEKLYSAEVIQNVKGLVGSVESQVKRQVRRSPFMITRCGSCGQWIITNRDILEEMTCRNCGNDLFVNNIADEAGMNRTLLDGIHGALGYELSSCNDYSVYILAFIPQTTDPSLVSEAIYRYGFEAAHCEGEIYEKLLRLGCDHGWVTPGCKVGFGKTVLDDRDCLFDGVIPRVEACARFVRKCTNNEVKTISVHVPPEQNVFGPEQPRQGDIRERIERLLAEGKLEEAAALMDQL